MTKKDYELIAKLIRKVSHPSVGIPSQGIKVIVLEFAHEFKKQNPRFKEVLFMECCGLEATR